MLYQKITDINSNDRNLNTDIKKYEDEKIISLIIQFDNLLYTYFFFSNWVMKWISL